ncbi:2817_t:CDS:2 [Gigaspora margarita]|uniref:2817_t:CDS:1 n=1 Tax=Gigaspora margarita TaxID=4874 RepID=A0ABM8W4Y3_GIGMA|nr:2817_t:CDS:2 [Gigaspora margarita]
MKKEREEEEKARKEKLQKEQEEQRKKSEKKKKITKKFRAVVINKQAVFCNICHDYLLPLLVKRLFKKEVKCENCALKMKEFPDENYNLCPKCLVKHYLQAANSNNREEIQLKESQLEVEQPEPEPET